MNEEVTIEDPKSKSKKKVVTITVSVLGILVIVSVVVFGQLLKEFLIFDANRTEAASELTKLKTRISEQENLLDIRKTDYEAQIIEKKNQLQQLEDSISKRDAQIASQQKLIDECSVLSERISSIQRDYQLALIELESARKSIATQEGTASGLKVEIKALLSQKKSLQSDLTGLDQTNVTSKQAVAQLANKIKLLGQEKATAQSEASVVQQALHDAATSLTNLNIQITNTRRISTQLEEETRTAKATNDLFVAQVGLMKEALKTKSAEKTELEKMVLELSQKSTRLSSEIPALDERKQLVESQLIVAEKKVEQAESRLQVINRQIEASLAQLLQIKNISASEIQTAPLQSSTNSLSE